MSKIMYNTVYVHVWHAPDGSMGRIITPDDEPHLDAVMNIDGFKTVCAAKIPGSDVKEDIKLYYWRDHKNSKGFLLTTEECVKDLRISNLFSTIAPGSCAPDDTEVKIASEVIRNQIRSLSFLVSYPSDAFYTKLAELVLLAINDYKRVNIKVESKGLSSDQSS